MMVPEEKKQNVLCFKASDAEIDLIHRKMEAAGIKNFSSFVRAMVLNGYVIKPDYESLREIIRLLKNMTNNINQIAARVNSGGSLYETELNEIKDDQQVLWDNMNQILIKLGH